MSRLCFATWSVRSGIGWLFERLTFKVLPNHKPIANEHEICRERNREH
jgi:hypothetical protein